MASKRALALALWPLALALDDDDDNHPGYPIPPAHRTQEKTRREAQDPHLDVGRKYAPGVP